MSNPTTAPQYRRWADENVPNLAYEPDAIPTPRPRHGRPPLPLESPFPGTGELLHRFYVGALAAPTGVKDAQREHRLTSVVDYTATHQGRRSDTGAEQAPAAEAVGSAATHAQQEERPVRVLLPCSIESGQIVVGDLIVAGGDVYDQKVTVVVVFDCGADVSLVGFAPESDCFLFGVPGAIHSLYVWDAGRFLPWREVSRGTRIAPRGVEERPKVLDWPLQLLQELSRGKHAGQDVPETVPDGTEVE